MAASEVLIEVLNNADEPLEKRLKIADNALSYPELQFHYKEPFLLKWILNNSQAQISDGKVVEVLKKWLCSREIQDLTQNDITNEDISDIIQLLKENLLQKDTPIFDKLCIVDSILLLCDIKVFQNYFAYNVEAYCELLSLCLEVISEPPKFVETLRRHLFPKELLIQESFVKQFLYVICPVLVSKAIEFQGNQEVFEEATKVVQKCIFQGHVREFQSFFNKALGIQSEEIQTSTLPKQVFKYLASNFQNEPLVAATTSKLLFSAFIETFKDTHWSFYYLIFLNNMLQINQSSDFTVSSPLKQKKNVTLSKALQIISVVLEKIATKNFVDCNVSKVSFTEYLRNILSFIMSSNVLNETVFEIIQTCIQITPLSIESIATTLVAYVISRYAEEFKGHYEETMNSILGVFSKLHRLENFVAKIVPVIKNLVNGPPGTESTYSFDGEQDLEPTTIKLASVNKILSTDILKYFAKCLHNLASWQTINMFKTLMFHLREAVLEFSKDTSATKHQIFNLEFLQKLTTTLLMYVKVADNSIPQNVIDKFVKGLNDLKDILSELGSAILKREHNQMLTSIIRLQRWLKKPYFGVRSKL